VLAINQRYFSSKKYAVEMFGAYMQEVNFKIFKIFNLFYLRFSFGSHVCTGNSTLRICGVVHWHGNVSNIILLHTHNILPEHITNNLSLHTTHSSHATFCVTVTNRDTPTHVECSSILPTCVILSIVYITRWNRESTWYFLTSLRKE
jgi:hypothetical protein